MKKPCVVLLASFLVTSAVRNRREKKSKSLLVPLGTEKPDGLLFPSRGRWPLAPAFTEVEGAKHTNKFWGNWVVDDGQGDFSIYPSPYTLKWKQVGESTAGALHVMKGDTDYAGTFYTCHWKPDFIIGAEEGFSGSHVIVKEYHFGIHAQVRPAAGFNCTMTFPVFAGMAFVSSKYEGTCTPKISSNYLIRKVQKVSNGIWSFEKEGGKEYRVYLLTNDGAFVDDSYDFSAEGVLNKPHQGWVRLANLQDRNNDGAVLDQYAQRILVGWDLRIEPGLVMYVFDTVGPGLKFLNWAYANHMQFLDSGAQVAELARTQSPVKGYMWPLGGGVVWKFRVDLTDALNVDFLPSYEPKDEHKDTILQQAEADLEMFKEKWRLSMHKRDHYFSGKGFQKVGMVCFILKKFKGQDDTGVQECANILYQGFKCMYDRNVSDGSDRRLSGPDGLWSQEEGCWWSPFGTWYDEDWGGIPSRWEDPPVCGLDFGNSCYNDHHYHWGYYVVSAAMLVDLMPSMASDEKFKMFINMFIRDVANPSPEDKWFPQFRAFDFFDMHSWSRGLKPDPSGKDQESTSEEVNFHYGMVLWGRAIGDNNIMQLGATTLTLASVALQEYFLLKRDNPNHPASFTINHVTGIFFQNKVHLTTWFGQDRKYIHGIQMLPLSAGVSLSRSPTFCFEEWYDQLQQLPIELENNQSTPWWTILFTGNLAMWDPEEAWNYLIQIEPYRYDDGLTKSWALYWTSSQPGGGERPTPAPTPKPAPGGGGPPGGEFCNPNADPPQYCLAGHQCPQCGLAACSCDDEPVPTPEPAPTPPTPAPAPTPEPPLPPAPGVWCMPNMDPPQYCPDLTECPDCGATNCPCP